MRHVGCRPSTPSLKSEPRRIAGRNDFANKLFPLSSRNRTGRLTRGLDNFLYSPVHLKSVTLPPFSQLGMPPVLNCVFRSKSFQFQLYCTRPQLPFRFHSNNFLFTLQIVGKRQNQKWVLWIDLGSPTGTAHLQSLLCFSSVLFFARIEVTSLDVHYFLPGQTH